METNKKIKNILYNKFLKKYNYYDGQTFKKLFNYLYIITENEKSDIPGDPCYILNKIKNDHLKPGDCITYQPDKKDPYYILKYDIIEKTENNKKQYYLIDLKKIIKYK